MQGPQCIGFGSRVVSVMLFQKYVGTVGLKIGIKGIADCEMFGQSKICIFHDIDYDAYQVVACSSRHLGWQTSRLHLNHLVDLPRRASPLNN